MCRSKMKAMAMLLVVCAAWMQLSRTSEADDWDLIRGKWRHASLKSDRGTFFEDELGRYLWMFDRERMRLLLDGTEQASLRISLNETARPKEYDVWYDGDDPTLKQRYPSVIHGIYEINGDTLRRCYAFDPDQRPTRFGSGTGSRNFLQVLKRVQADPGERQ
jgi:uncharacterized protein (TIGR03067 family)